VLDNFGQKHASSRQALINTPSGWPPRRPGRRRALDRNQPREDPFPVLALKAALLTQLLDLVT
jgi:hypothetical protein